MGDTLRSDRMFMRRLQKLLNEMEFSGCVLAGLGHDYSDYNACIKRGFELVTQPDRKDMDAYNAYVNLKYHANHPGALYMNDIYTRTGVEMALQAVENEI